VLKSVSPLYRILFRKKVVDDERLIELTTCVEEPRPLYRILFRKKVVDDERLIELTTCVEERKAAVQDLV
jgi:hypothetical protein